MELNGRRFLSLALLGAALLPQGVVLPTASAQLPTTNGVVAFDAFFGSNGTDICVMEPDTTGSRRIVTGPRDQGNPAWSPDGSRLAYVDYQREGGLDPVIRVLDLRTGITQDLGPGNYPTWSPLGNQLAFTRDFDGIYVMNADGSARARIVEGGDRPSWSPDGSAIAFDDDIRDFDPIDNGGVWLTAPDGSNQRRIGDGEYPAYSPDGRAIVANSGYWAFALLIMSSDGSEQRTLIEGNAPDGPTFYDPEWAPDGSVIIFQRNSPTYNGDIWQVSPTGSEPTPFRATARFEGNPDWQPTLPGSPEVPDGIPCVPHPFKRMVSFEVTGHLIASGVVTSTDDHDECASGTVVIRRETRYGEWSNVSEHATTDDEGRFRFRIRDRSGRYKAVVVPDDPCARAESPVTRHRH